MLLRVFVNINVLLLLVVSAYAVIYVVEESDNIHDNSWWARNKITMVMSFISLVFPMLFEILGLLEYYHPRIQLRLQLARIMILNLLNLYSLIWALFGKINGMTKELAKFKEDDGETTTTIMDYSTTESTSFLSTTLEGIGSVAATTAAIFVTLATAASLLPKNVTETENSTEPEMVDTTQYSYPDSSTTEAATEHYDYTNYDYFERADVLKQQQEQYQDVLIDHNHHDLSLPEDMEFDEGNRSISDALNSSTVDYNFLNDSTDSTTDGGDYRMSSTTSDTKTEESTSWTLDFSSTSTEVNKFGFEPQITPPPNNFMHKTASDHFAQEKPHSIKKKNLTTSQHLKLRKLCWETMFGQELVKLTVMDLVSM